MDTTTLATPRLDLRPFTPDDAEAVHLACQDADVRRWTTIPDPYTREDADTFTAKQAENWAEDKMYNFGVFAKGNGALVSSMGLMVRGPQLFEIGYWTAKEQRGQGYTAEAAETVCRWGFETLQALRIEWRAAAGNEGSRAVMRRLGFTFEGTLRNFEYHRGAITDLWIGSLIPADLGYPNPPKAAA